MKTIFTEFDYYLPELTKINIDYFVKNQCALSEIELYEIINKLIIYIHAAGEKLNYLERKIIELTGDKRSNND